MELCRFKNLLLPDSSDHKNKPIDVLVGEEYYYCYYLQKK